jgi:hypothetical protein
MTFGVRVYVGVKSILQDVHWLGLKEGTDFKPCLDLPGEPRVSLLALLEALGVVDAQHVIVPAAPGL